VLSVSVPTADGRLPSRDTFAWTVLNALAGEVEAEVDQSKRVSITMTKKRGATGLL
jgi:serine/threonine-protein kinase RsbW